MPVRGSGISCVHRCLLRAVEEVLRSQNCIRCLFTCVRAVGLTGCRRRGEGEEGGPQARPVQLHVLLVRVAAVYTFSISYRCFS